MRPVVTVVSYNVRAGIGPGPFPPAWWTRIDEARLGRMAEFIAQVDADLVCLQEVALASVDGLVIDQPALFGRLTGFDIRYGSVCPLPLIEPPPSGRVVGAHLWGDAILSRYPILTTTTHALPVTPDDPADPVDTEPRCALACHVATPAGRLTLISTHLAYLGQRARRRQACRLAEIVTQTGGPLILAGDLNAAIEQPELSELRPLLVDSFAAVGLAPGDAQRESCGVDQIDHVLTRSLDVVECRVAREAGELSDHWPVVARLRLSDGAGSSGSARAAGPG